MMGRGRGTCKDVASRFDVLARMAEPDSDPDFEPGRQLPTEVIEERARSIISSNSSPDVPFNRSVNPYAGCEHGCIYCYARPSHGYLNLSPGLDFETKLFAKPEAAKLLRTELARPSYRCSPIALGVNTDSYQPIERELKIVRQVLEVLAECKHPLSIITKSALVERDIDLLAQLASDNLVQVFISVTTLDAELARKLEPRAASPRRRLQAMRVLNAAGVPCGVLVAPVIPFLTDSELESILQAASEHGARTAAYTLLRLPYELKDLFKDWLAVHYPLKAEHVMSRLREMRDGRENDPEFGSRFRGSGLFAQLLSQRFQLARERLGLNLEAVALDITKFVKPNFSGQRSLF